MLPKSFPRRVGCQLLAGWLLVYTTLGLSPAARAVVIPCLQEREAELLAPDQQEALALHNPGVDLMLQVPESTIGFALLEGALLFGDELPPLAMPDGWTDVPLAPLGWKFQTPDGWMVLGVGAFDVSLTDAPYDGEIRIRAAMHGTWVEETLGGAASPGPIPSGIPWTGSAPCLFTGNYGLEAMGEIVIDTEPVIQTDPTTGLPVRIILEAVRDPSVTITPDIYCFPASNQDLETWSEAKIIQYLDTHELAIELDMLSTFLNEQELPGIAAGDLGATHLVHHVNRMPAGGREPVLSVGVSFAGLHASCLTEELPYGDNDYALDHPEALGDFESSFVGPGDDVAVWVSGRLLQRVATGLAGSSLQDMGYRHWESWTGRERVECLEGDFPSSTADGAANCTDVVDVLVPGESDPRLHVYATREYWVIGVHVHIDLRPRLQGDPRAIGEEDPERILTFEPEVSVSIHKPWWLVLLSFLVPPIVGYFILEWLTGMAETLAEGYVADEASSAPIQASFPLVVEGAPTPGYVALDRVAPTLSGLALSGRAVLPALGRLGGNPWLPPGALVGWGVQAGQEHLLGEGFEAGGVGSPVNFVARWSEDMGGDELLWRESLEPSSHLDGGLHPAGLVARLTCEDQPFSNADYPSLSVPWDINDEHLPDPFVAYSDGGDWPDDWVQQVYLEGAEQLQLQHGADGELTGCTFLGGSLSGEACLDAASCAWWEANGTSSYSDMAGLYPIGTTFALRHDDHATPGQVVDQPRTWTSCPGPTELVRRGAWSACLLDTTRLDRDQDFDRWCDRCEEWETGTSLKSWDTDRDGIRDSLEGPLGEVMIGQPLDPTSADPDGDGISDWYEVVVFGTDPFLADSDNDGLFDGDELFCPWSSQLDPTDPDVDDDGVLDGDEDSNEHCIGYW